MSKNWKRYVSIAVGALAVVAGVIWAYMPSSILVEIAPVVRGDFQRVIEEDGKTRVRDRYVVSAPIGGRLLRMRWKAGDNVEHDAVVAQLVPTPSGLLDARTRRELQEQFGAADASVLQADAEIRRLNVVLEDKRTEFERARKLLSDRFISQAEFDRARMAVAAAEKTLEVAKAQKHVSEHRLDEARAALSTGDRSSRGDFKLVAPIAGSVLRVLQESETVVNVGQPLLELADPDNIEVVVELLTDDAQLVAPGAPVVMQRAGLTPLQGVVRLVEPAARTKISALGIEEQRVNVIIDMTSPRDERGNLGDGYKLGVQIQVERQSNAITVPVGAVFAHNEGAAVFAVDDAGRARLRSIKTGSSNRSHATILSGLTESDRVIVYPSDVIADGVKVKSH